MNDSTERTLDDRTLAGRVALVTGSGQGIGREIARSLATAGARVVVADRNRETGSAVASELGGLFVELDVTNSGGVRGAVESIAADLGRIDILVNNAGISWGERPETMPLEKWQRVLDTNLTGAFLFAQAAGRIMLEARRGSIINVASVAGLRSAVHGPHYAGYAASKAGLMGLTRELAAAWGPHGIRVNAIAPGFFHSRLADAVIEHVEPQIKARNPIPRVGASGELKGLALLLASDASSYITGQIIAVDGGATIV
ncbi:MAG TPA: SDR family oxidoreductase [Thermoanaerobaculia bacterium]|nr:SDR family oxidoreductase [Thermoanaerobaculia bacterium]